MYRAFMWYDTRLISHPLLVKSITSGVLTLFGDFTAQALLNPSDQAWSMPRMLVFGFLGTVFIGPVLHVWYGGVHGFGRVALTSLPKSSRRITALTVMADQLIFAPIFLTTYLTCYTYCMARVDEVMPKVRMLYGEVLFMNYVYWVPVQWVNFAYIIPRYNVLFSNVAAIAWNSYLSWKQNPR